MIEGNLPRFKLTIGELFPADDLLAQWVFSLTSLAEDLGMLLAHLKTKELREMVLFNRLLITRLYEARRLAWAWRDHSEISEFSKTGLKFGDVDLAAAYAKPAGQGKSFVEQMYADSRHRTVHYSYVDKPELRSLLEDYRALPARMVAHLDLRAMWQLSNTSG